MNQKMNQKWWYWLGLAGLLSLMGMGSANAGGEGDIARFIVSQALESESVAALSEADSAALVDISGDVVVSGTSIPVCALVLANGKSQFSCDGQGHYTLDDVWLDSAGQVTLYAWAEGFNPYKTVFTPTSTSVNQRVAMTVPSCGGPYTLTVNSSGASGVQISSSTGHGGTTNYTKTGIAPGTSVSLTALQSASGKNFSSWSGCTSISGTNCTLSMTANKTVTANYTGSTSTARWGVLTDLCANDGGLLTFSATIDGVTKKSITQGCGAAAPSWEGYATTTPGTKYDVPAKIQIQQGTLPYSFSSLDLPQDTCTLIASSKKDGQILVGHAIIDCNTLP